MIVSPRRVGERGGGSAPRARRASTETSRFAKRSRTGPGGQPAAVAEPLHEALALERRDEPRGRALRQPGPGRELADRRRLRGLDDAHEELRRAVDRLGAGRFSHLTSWNRRSTEILAAPAAGVKRLRAARRAPGDLEPEAVRIEEERRVVLRVVLRPEARRVQDLAARRHGRCMRGVDIRRGLDREREVVQARARRARTPGRLERLPQPERARAGRREAQVVDLLAALAVDEDGGSSPSGPKTAA